MTVAKFILNLSLLASIFLISGFTAKGNSSEISISSSKQKQNGCSANSDKLYNRQQILEQFGSFLDDLFLEANNEQRYAKVFFVQDLTDITNNYGIGKSNCINFINNHIYYFASIRYDFSSANIVILEDGKLKTFRNINCHESKDSLRDVLKYLDEKLKNDKNKNEILIRVGNYRQYGFYAIFDYPLYGYCKSGKRPFDSDYKFNPDNLFNGGAIENFGNLLYSSIPQHRKKFHPGFFVDWGKAIGFFIYDLTDPANRQTSLTEDVHLLKNHVYHFAPIDLPWSYSYIAVLGETEVKIFKALNCPGKGDKIEDVIAYLNRNLKNDKNKKEIVARVKDYRKYGVYTSFNNSSTIRCGDLKIDKSKVNQ